MYDNAFENAIECHHYGGRGTRDIDRLHLYQNGFKDGSTRKRVYDNSVRRAAREGRVPKEAGEVLVEIKKRLRSYIHETDLQQMSRLDREFENLVQGGMSRSNFRALWDSKLQDMEESPMDMPTETTLYRKYLQKLNNELRVRVLQKQWRLDGPNMPPRDMKTHEDVAIACMLTLEEKADICAAGSQGNNDSFMMLDNGGAMVLTAKGQHISQGAKKNGSPGQGGSKNTPGTCNYCHQPGHPAAVCPQRAADTRGDTPHCQKRNAESGRVCNVCQSPNHEAIHHTQAADDYAGYQKKKGADGGKQDKKGERDRGGNPTKKDGGGQPPKKQPLALANGDKERKPCKFGAKCRNLLNGGVCAGWHERTEYKDLMTKYREAHPEAAKGEGGKGQREKGKGKGNDQESVAVASEQRQQPPKNNKKKGGGISEGTGDVNYTIHEEVRSVCEQVAHDGSSTERVMNTIELSDYFGTSPDTELKPCYSLDSALTLDESLKVGAAAGLGGLIDRLQATNPAFCNFHLLNDLPPSEFLERELQRPVGYSATTRVHVGRLCIPMLNDSGATCSCITEETMMLLVNHTVMMTEAGKISHGDYNYPIKQPYRYKQPAHLRGANQQGSMTVEFAVSLNIEFIPDGAERGPVKEIYFKIFKAGSCGIAGGVLGWPTLDHPVVPGGEGLGWRNQEHGAEYTALGVTLPRLDDHRKTNYNSSVARYSASSGQLLAIHEDSVTGETVNLIDASAAQQFRAASLLASKVPIAMMEPIGLECVSLNPGERAVLPVKWKTQGRSRAAECSTHPDAPAGLTVLPGPCTNSECMSVVVENESPLPITITEHDFIAIGVSEEEVPSLDSCLSIQARRD